MSISPDSLLIIASSDPSSEAKPMCPMPGVPVFPFLFGAYYFSVSSLRWVKRLFQVPPHSAPLSLTPRFELPSSCCRPFDTYDFSCLRNISESLDTASYPAAGNAAFAGQCPLKTTALPSK